MPWIIVGAIIVGLTLGMLGSGGSALTVPVLIYMVGHGAKESIAESMAIVGLISLIAAIPYARSGQIDWRSVVYFGLPGMLGTLIGAQLGGLANEALQLSVFGGVLLVSAIAMLRSGEEPASDPDRAADDGSVDGKLTPQESSSVVDKPPRQVSAWKIGLEGISVGVLTGFVGVGGGFLIVPALVVLGKLPMRLAIGTSLVIIAIKAAVGFAKYEHYLLAHDLTVHWQTIGVFSIVGVFGSWVGRRLNTKLNQRALQRVFAGFLILLGGVIVVQEGSRWIAANRASPPEHSVTAEHTVTAEPTVTAEQPTTEHAITSVTR